MVLMKLNGSLFFATRRVLFSFVKQDHRIFCSIRFFLMQILETQLTYQDELCSAYLMRVPFDT